MAAILNISKRSMMTKWHHSDLKSAGRCCLETMKTFRADSSARYFGLETGLIRARGKKNASFEGALKT